MSQQDTKPICVRPFEERDIPQLLAMMEALAEFEGYRDDFRVTADDLRTRGLSRDPQFHALVASLAAADDALLGMSVYHLIPYTYDLTPELVLKEMFVADDARGHGVGQALMHSVIAAARHRGCRRIRWLVLPDNGAAQNFYRQFGAQRDDSWERWGIDL